MPLLSSKDKSSLRSVAQTLKPLIHIGKNGLQEGVLAELNKAFCKLELIKVAFKGDRTRIEELVVELEKLTGSQCVGGVGKRRSFYRALEQPESE